MSNRWFNLGVVTFWLVAMSWLLSQKVIPPLLPGEPPDYNAPLAETLAHRPPPPVCWRITWEGKIIGTAASQSVSTSDGAELRSAVHFKRLPVRNLLVQSAGLMGAVVKATMGEEDFSPDLNAATRIRFNQHKRLQGFQTVIDLPDLPQFLDFDGRMNEAGKLVVKAHARFGVGEGRPATPIGQPYELDLPPDALVGDSLSPRSELKNLRVGQKWTIPAYRPFPPGEQMQILLANVERSEYLEWNGELMETFVVVYRDEAGSGLKSAGAPIGRTWAQPDGTVLRQEVKFSSLKIIFERLPSGQAQEAESWLEDNAFEQVFAGLEPPPPAASARNGQHR
jgi:hypothetical protein